MHCGTEVCAIPEDESCIVTSYSIEDDQLTVAAVFAAVKRDAKDWRRPHLGASVLGKECDRAVWYSFRWVQDPEHDGRILALFDRGTVEEPRVFSKLRAAGITVRSTDHETGKQWFVELGPHMSGSADSIVQGLLEDPDTQYVLDVKTAGVKSFERMLKAANARAWSVDYWAQQQLYMHGLIARGIEVRMAALMIVCKDDDRMHLLRFPYEQVEAERLLARGRRIVVSEDPPMRISNDPTAWGCKFCDYHATCQLGQYAKLERNCRTCLHSTAEQDGSWSCAFHAQTINTIVQKHGCTSHLFRPGLMPRGWEPIDTDENEITYKDASGELWVDRDCQVVKS
jgi:hypothetical protein